MTFHAADDRIGYSMPITVDRCHVESGPLIGDVDIDLIGGSFGVNRHPLDSGMAGGVGGGFAGRPHHGIEGGTEESLAHRDEFYADVVISFDPAGHGLEGSTEQSRIGVRVGFEQPLTQFTLLGPGQGDHLVGVVGPLNERQCLEDRIMQVGGNLRSFFGTDSVAAFLVECRNQPDDPRPDQQHEDRQP